MSGDGAPPPAVRLRLYVSGFAPNSVAARANLAICLRGVPAEVEVIDLAEQPARALDDHVLFTPMLIRVGTREKAVIIGDLRDHARVRAVLGLSPLLEASR